ncbi:type II toxin-antitoxin system RelE/ParE family toxin [Cohnella herbarum]|uniref:Type II toxin-antitoxin system RelE/ParE family toxin n=1 Tax=Cohnella herbarum TaxID=2728023 RepID=A0A7Z2VNJ8_9BACL|nr:type II toxin-antitoxin system RelE/ParE family toxin [Cohnella herbarum]QJD86353.1 type II toxin-antitoxin system RelE/ParE family toxin [Cohnella herbarum]
MKFSNFLDARGKDPVSSFVATLTSKERSKIDRYIRLIEEQGIRIGEPYVGHIEGKIWEVRPGNYRILFFVEGDNWIATNVFRKKGQKTPESEKHIARTRRDEWLKRHE